MTGGEFFISFLLVIIAYLLYHIAKQLSYITGKKIKISFLNWQINKPFKKPPTERLSN
jgi:hypothetical protein